MQNRTTLASLIYLMVFASNTWAQDEPNKIYIPSKNGVRPQIFNQTTGTSSEVLVGMAGKPPADCPPENYWAIDTDKIARCADGVKFFLEPLTSGKYPVGYMAVKPVDPKETPEPGPDIMN